MLRYICLGIPKVSLYHLTHYLSRRRVVMHVFSLAQNVVTSRATPFLNERSICRSHWNTINYIYSLTDHSKYLVLYSSWWFYKELSMVNSSEDLSSNNFTSLLSTSSSINSFSHLVMSCEPWRREFLWKVGKGCSTKDVQNDIKRWE